MAAVLEVIAALEKACITKEALEVSLCFLCDVLFIKIAYAETLENLCLESS